MKYLPLLILLIFSLNLNAQTRQYIHNDYFHAVSVGKVEAASSEVKFGFNTDIDIAAEEDIWSVGGSVPYLTSAEKIYVKSTDADDNSSGTGARTVRVIGLDGSYNVVQEDVTLNGTTADTTTQTFLRVHRLYVLTAGTTGTNEGVISATAYTSTTVQGNIPADYGQSQLCVYTIPAGKTGYVIGAQFTCVKTGTGQDPIVEFHGNIRTLGGAWRRIFTAYLDVSDDSYADVPQMLQVAIPEKTDVKVSCETNKDDTVASARLYIVLYDN